MTTDTGGGWWRRVEAVLDDALARDVSERGAFLDAACDGDAALRAEVDSLLAAHDGTGAADRLASALQPTAARVRGAAAPFTGQRVGHYHVHEPIGGGGMGIVYRATDTRLDRTVALKFLRLRFGTDTSATERFRLEARTVAALEHPNICTLLEIGETGDGQLFLSMPHYAGETLRERIGRGPLDPHEAADIAAQIARALAWTHARGIVHRDIKPSNVLVTDYGVVKLLDFGIATLTGDAAIGRTPLSEPSSSDASPVGTAAYMSPEQARGDAVDHRTDLWSLGVVLHEMLTGHRPSANATPSVPATFRLILARALAVSPDDRYVSADAFERDLLALTRAASLRSAVPIDGAPMHQSRRASTGRRRIVAIAALGLLVPAAWLGLTRPAARVADAAPAVVIATDSLTHEGADDRSYELYQKGRQALYLKGRYAWYSRTEQGLRDAAAHFEQAVAATPRYARAHAGLADAYAVLGFYDYMKPSEAFPQAEAAALRAASLDPKLGAPHATLGYVALYHHWSIPRGEAAFRRAIALEPSYSTAHQWYANLLVAAGRFDEAERAMRRAEEIDPLSLIAKSALGWVLYHAGNHEAALAQCRETLEISPDYAVAHLWSGWVLEALDSLPQAVAAHRRALVAADSGGLYLASLARALVLAGEREEAGTLMRRLDALDDSGRYVPAYEIAKVHAALGDIDEAFAWLERARRERSHSMVFLRVDPQLASLRGDARYGRLLERVFAE